MRQIPLVILAVATSLLCAPGTAFSAEGRRLAYLVAVTEYSHAGLDPLEFTERDIDDLSKRLAEVGFDVVSLTPQRGKTDPKWKPTAENIRTQLPEFLHNRKVGRHDLVLLGLSGHGLQPRGSGDSFFCPADANPTMSDSDQGKKQTPKFPQTLVSVGELLSLMDESGVGHKLVLVDACRNEPKSKGAKTTGIDRVNLGELPGQTAVLLSCSKGEFSFENRQFGGGHGAFFHQVIEGLSGKARDNDQQITFDSLAAYVRKNVPAAVDKVYGAAGGRQRPNQISNVEGEPLVLIPTAMLAKVNSVNPGPAPKREPTTQPTAGTTETGDIQETKAGQERDDNILKLRLVWCPKGSFRMGSPKDEKGRKPDEDQVTVTLSNGFWLGKFEVTQAQYEQVMGKNPSFFTASGEGASRVSSQQTAQFPVEQVSYDDAMVLCKRFTETERKAGRLPAGWEYNLPTEAQWEYACRTGKSDTSFSFGQSLNGTEANCDGEIPYGTTNKGKNLGRTTVVGSYPANEWGLHDMHGNVWELCRDAYNWKLTGGTDPEVKTGSERAVRGGGWYTGGAEHCRSACRFACSPDDRSSPMLGFRVALSEVNVVHAPNRDESAETPVDTTAIGELNGATAGQERDDNALKLKLVWCPPGDFKMGSPKVEKQRKMDEDQVSVTLTKGFWLGKFEVTQAEYFRVMNAKPSRFSGVAKNPKQYERYPVEMVSYDDSLEFCRQLTASERAAGRLPSDWEYTLPTEAQWEYACRTATSVKPFSFGDKLSGEQANFSAEYLPRSPTGQALNPIKSPVQVGSYPANKWGLHDMHGNVREWCRDTYAEKLPGGIDPLVDAGSQRVNRGGSWSTGRPIDCRSAARSSTLPTRSFNYLGFRLACVSAH